MDELICFKCHKILRGISKYAAHFRRYHSIMLSRPQTSGFCCRQEDCDRHFLNFGSLIRHIKTFHLYCETDSLHVPVVEISEPLGIVDANEDELLADHNEQSNEILDETVEEEIHRVHDIHMSASKLVANLRASSSFTGAALTRVVGSTACLVSDISEFVQDEIIDFCRSKDIDIKSPDVETLLGKFNFTDLFNNMDSLQGQIEALKKHYQYIDPIEVPLGYRQDQRFSKKDQTLRQKQIYETFQYVSIIETLKLMMSHDAVRKYVETESDAPNDWLINFRDGYSFKTNEFFQKYPTAIRIQLYYDDIVVNNPLGSKVHPHKIGAFYFVVQNLPQHLTSFLGGIQVLALCHTADIDKYGMKSIFKPFLRDLKELESDSGVKVTYNGEPWTLRASLAAVCADGLAAHQLFGFLSPSAQYFCRLCMINRNDFIENKTTPPPMLRTKESYNQHIRNIAEKKSLKDIQAMRTACGIKEDSALHSSRHFHCMNNRVFDGMHDGFEGVIPMEIKLVIHHFVTNENYNFNFDTFNSRIHLFQYGLPEVKNKPSANFSMASIMNLKDHKLSQTAAQTWCLLRVFPFLVSDIVPEDDEYLGLILLLCRIMEIVFAPELRRSILPHFSALIADHEMLFRKLFPDVNTINKHHHLTHYPDCIDSSGPLRWLSCFRFEAKHGLLKKHGSVCHNYKNITKTLINVCQISQCAVWGIGEYPRNKLAYSKGTNAKVRDTLSRQGLHNIGLKDNTCVIKTSSIEVYGIKYRNGLFVALDSGIGAENHDVVFGCIEEIVVLKDEQVCLWCTEWPALGLSESLNAYCVAEESRQRFMNIDDLPDLKPFSIWRDYKTDYSYIALRHILL